jgi:hypothetical protein
MNVFTWSSTATTLAAIGTTMLLGRQARAAHPKLLVFLHTAVKQRALQEALSSALPGVSVTAVGRVADFERKLAEKPDAVLSLPVVLESMGLSPTLRGHRAGAPSEKYVLIGADTAPDPQTVTSVGALDILGRSGTTAFVASLLGSRPKVVRVTKLEDLLPLLQMRRADAIVLPARLGPAVSGASRLALAQRELSGSVALPAVAAVTGDGVPAVIAAIRSLAASTSSLVGVDSWH